MRLLGFHVSTSRIGNMQWCKHIFSLCLGHTSWGNFLGLVVHTWGLRIGLIWGEVVVFWPKRRRA